MFVFNVGRQVLEGFVTNDAKGQNFRMSVHMCYQLAVKGKTLEAFLALNWLIFFVDSFYMDLQVEVLLESFPANFTNVAAAVFMLELDVISQHVGHGVLDATDVALVWLQLQVDPLDVLVKIVAGSEGLAAVGTFKAFHNNLRAVDLVHVGVEGSRGLELGIAEFAGN